MKAYARRAAMIGTSTVVMLVLMYLDTYAADHVFFSETRLYMALTMGAATAIVMLGMCDSAQANAAIFAGAAVVSGVMLWLARSQATIEDVSWMKAMIPHRSIAVLTSERANLSDPRVRKLADAIIEPQRREIGEMQAPIAGLGKPR